MRISITSPKHIIQQAKRQAEKQSLSLSAYLRQLVIRDGERLATKRKKRSMGVKS